jgi:hypothetical protein
VVELQNGEVTSQTRIIDYTGNPHTVQFLAEYLEVAEGRLELQFDVSSPVDVQVVLGVDWSQKIQEK